MTRLDFGGQRSRSQQAVEVGKGIHFDTMVVLVSCFQFNEDDCIRNVATFLTSLNSNDDDDDNNNSSSSYTNNVNFPFRFYLNKFADR